LAEKHERETAGLRAELEAARKERDAHRADAATARTHAATLRKGIVGGSSSIPTGEVTRSPALAATPTGSAPEALLAGDVAANVARLERAEAPR
jgi:hypothetical protein